jgi:hypothetical protein
MLKRHGSRHDIYMNPATGMSQPVPKKVLGHIMSPLKKVEMWENGIFTLLNIKT